MEPLKYRWKARFIGEVDRILTVMTICFIVLRIVGAISASCILALGIHRPGEKYLGIRGVPSFALFEFNIGMRGNSDTIQKKDGLIEKEDFYSVSLYVWIVVCVTWFVLATALLVSFLEFAAANKLIKSTPVETEADYAKENACYWRNINIIFTMLSGFNFFSGQLFLHIITGIIMVIRVIAICVVQMYINELDLRIASEDEIVPVESHAMYSLQDETPTCSGSKTKSNKRPRMNCHYTAKMGNNAASAYAEIYACA